MTNVTTFQELQSAIFSNVPAVTLISWTTLDFASATILDGNVLVNDELVPIKIYGLDMFFIDVMGLGSVLRNIVFVEPKYTLVSILDGGTIKNVHTILDEEDATLEDGLILDISSYFVDTFYDGEISDCTNRCALNTTANVAAKTFKPHAFTTRTIHYHTPSWSLPYLIIFRACPKSRASSTL